eukprot:COSAG02_NODE_5901_length_3949_cov_3.300779_1_plen_54_part_00
MPGVSSLPRPIPTFRVFFLRRWLGMVAKVDGHLGEGVAQFEKHLASSRPQGVM